MAVLVVDVVAGRVALCVGLAWVEGVRLVVGPRPSRLRTRTLARLLGGFVASLCSLYQKMQTNIIK